GDAMPRNGASLAFDTLGAWRASGVAWVAPSVLPAALATLHARLHAALIEAGFALENRPFRPHVTLARRCVQPHPRQQSAPIHWSVRKMCLIRCGDGAEGPVHTTLAQWTLQVPP